MSGVIKNGLKRLGISVVESNHILLGDYEILQKAKEWFCYDSELSPLFTKLVENYPTQTIPPFVNYYIEIVLENPNSYIEADRTIAQITPLEISKSEKVSATSVIVEDLNDAIFYNHILKWYAERNSILANFSFNSVHGGGGRIIEVIKQEIRKEHVSMTIIDTDKRYPSYNINSGETYKSIKKLGKNKAFYKLLPLDVHEIENLIPSNYIDCLNDWNTPSGKEKKYFYDCLKVSPDSILPYFDLKKGIKKSKVVCNKEYYEFAKQCYECNSELMKKNSDFATYVDSLGVDENVYHGLISNLMKNVLQLLRIKPINPDLFDFQLENWKIIGQNLVNWTVARNKETLY